LGLGGKQRSKGGRRLAIGGFRIHADKDLAIDETLAQRTLWYGPQFAEQALGRTCVAYIVL
jgi:hypothetical protein